MKSAKCTHCEQPRAKGSTYCREHLAAYHRARRYRPMVPCSCCKQLKPNGKKLDGVAQMFFDILNPIAP